MPLILRKVKKGRWKTNKSWLPSWEYQADILDDLRTKNNEISVWVVRDDKSNIERIIAALGSSGDYLSNFDYALFDLTFLKDLDIKFSKRPGITPDHKANIKWHLNLEELTLHKVANLARKINEGYITSGVEIRRFQEKNVSEFIANGINQGNIDKEILYDNQKSKILTKLEKKGLISRRSKM